MNKNTLATITGYALAAITAAQPAINAVGTGSLHQGDYVNLALAILLAVFGHKTEYKPKAS